LLLGTEESDRFPGDTYDEVRCKLVAANKAVKQLGVDCDLLSRMPLIFVPVGVARIRDIGKHLRG
jgi:hypothetical protein